MNSSVANGQHEYCPAPDTLAAFAEGRLSEPDIEQVAEHLETCPTCIKTVRDLLREPADSLEAGFLRACADDPIPTESTAYKQMEKAAQALCDGNATSHSSVGRDESLPEVQGLGTVGPYTLLEVLGRGGMGIVYLASHRVLRRTVALKTLLPGRHAHPEALARFWVEAAAAARLNHPNVVGVEHFDESPQGPYLTMEFVEGETLARKLARGPMAFREAAELVRTLAAAVAYAHRQNVVHRDLKPSNVLIDRDGNPKVTDFGLARILGDDRERLTRSDAVQGTPAYMAPEQAAGRQAEIGPRTDVYALGAILHETLVGAPPHAGSGKSRLLSLVRAGAVKAPSGHCTSIPRELEAICLKCLEPSHKDRYATAESLVHELERWLKGEPTRTRPVGRFGTAVRAVRRRHRAIAMVALFATLVICVVSLGPRWFRPDVPDGESEVARRELEAELTSGRLVTLVGESGWPRWFSWRAGREPERRMHIAPDGVFSAEMLDNHATGLLELLPDPMTDRYKVTAQLRHDRSEYGGAVGLYVAHRAYPRQPRDVQFFMQSSFNAVNRVPVVVGPGQKPEIPPGLTSEALLSPRLYAQQGDPPNVDQPFGGVRGPRMQALGAWNGRWHDLEVTVTTDRVVATLNGNKLTLGPDALTAAGLSVGPATLRERHPRDPFLRDLCIEYAPRGGLGLILFTGAVSVRRVTVTPLRAGP